MARQASKVKLGYYPSPPPILPALARLFVSSARDTRLRVFDPCCGDGNALALLSAALREQHQRVYGRFADWEASTWGIEIQEPLARLADERLDHVLHASFFGTTLSNGDSSDRGWQFIYLNPPYDDDSESASGKGARRQRLEYTFLQRATLKLCTGGILVWVIPQYVLRRPGVARFLSEHYDRHACLRFPDELWRPPGSEEEVSMYGQFRQVIWMGRKRALAIPPDAEQVAQVEAWSALGASLPSLPLDQDGAVGLPRYEIPTAPYGELRHFAKGSFDPDAAAARVGRFTPKARQPRAGVWESLDYWTARLADAHSLGLKVGHPMHRFKKGYLIVFAVAGLVNRAVLTGTSGRRILVKGHTRKTTHYSCREDEVEKVEKVTDRFQSSLWCTDLDSGELILVETEEGSRVPWPVPYERMGMQAFLEEFGDSLMQQVMHLSAPRYQRPSQIPWAGQAFAHVLRKPLGRQLDTILAQVHALVNRWHGGDEGEDELLRRFSEIAEMASGKTYMAIVTAFLADLYACGAVESRAPATRLLHLFPMVVLVPTTIAPKWKREIEATIPNARVLIVERFGPRRVGEDEDDEGDDAEEGQPPTSFSDARAAFREFDPGFGGLSLGTVGVVDRAVQRIREDLTAWQREYERALAHNRAVRDGSAPGEAVPLPLKPCHVLILTFNTAKMMPQWMPVYTTRPLVRVDRRSGLVSAARGEQAGLPVMIPTCPSCGRSIKNERAARAQLAKPGSEYQERMRNLARRRAEREKERSRLGSRLNALDERAAFYLDTLDGYRALVAEREALRRGQAPGDEPFCNVQARLAAYLERERQSSHEYRALLAARDEALRDSGEGPQLAQAERLIAAYLARLSLSDANYRALLVRHDQRLRELELACEERIAAYLAQLAESDEAYRELLSEHETVLSAYLHSEHRMMRVEEESAEPVYLYLSEQELLGSKDHRVRYTCSECGEPLWQYVPKRPKDWRPFSVLSFLPAQVRVREQAGGASRREVRGSRHVTPLPLPSADALPPCVRSTYQRRFAMADYIADRYPGFFRLLVADEVHEGADGTALEQARAVLAKACGRMLALTGTLSNGYASSLFRLCYLLLKLVRQQFQYEDVGRWIDVHGRRQMVQKSKFEEPPTGSGSDSKRKVKPGMPVYKEIPGFDASGMGKIARCATLTDLKDVVPDLVGYHEEIRVVEMGDTLGPVYEQFEWVITEKMGAALSAGDKSVLSPWYTALLTYPDLPWLGWTCRTKYGLELGKALALPEQVVFPIERALIDYVQEQHLAGYRVLVFTENTGKYDDQPRLKQLFETKVRGRGGRPLKVEILRSTTTKKSMDREAWLNRCVERGVDVLICNPALVKVGLDLLAFPRIAYKRVPKKVTDLRQSARRSLRPGQTENVEVVFFTYLGSMALRLLHWMARRTQSSLLVEGKIASEGLVALSFDEEEEEGDLQGRMARELLGALKEGTLAMDRERLAEELHEMARLAAEIERKQHQLVGDEQEPPEPVLDPVRVVPLVSTPQVVVLGDDTPPHDAPASSEDAGAALPPLAAEQLAPATIGGESVTIIPVTVTDDPWSTPIAVEVAAADVWATLRAQMGGSLAGRKRRRR